MTEEDNKNEIDIDFKNNTITFTGLSFWLIIIYLIIILIEFFFDLVLILAYFLAKFIS